MTEQEGIPSAGETQLVMHQMGKERNFPVVTRKKALTQFFAPLSTLTHQALGGFDPGANQTPELPGPSPLLALC